MPCIIHKNDPEDAIHHPHVDDTRGPRRTHQVGLLRLVSVRTLVLFRWKFFGAEVVVSVCLR